MTEKQKRPATGLEPPTRGLQMKMTRHAHKTQHAQKKLFWWCIHNFDHTEPNEFLRQSIVTKFGWFGVRSDGAYKIQTAGGATLSTTN